MLCREREPASQGGRDARAAKDQVRLRESADGSRLPEGGSGIRCRTVGIDGPVPVADEIVKSSVVSLHIENKLDKAGRPLSEAAITGIAIQIEEQHDSAGRVVDACDSLEASVARRQATVLVIGVHAQRNGPRSRARHTTGQPRQLPDHLGQGSRLAMISLTEKSAAAMHESAAP